MPTSSTDSRLSLAEVNRLRHRSHGVIQSCLTRAGLLVSAAAELVRERAAAAFRLLCEEEGRIHGVPAAAVALHEVGAVDAIVDLFEDATSHSAGDHPAGRRADPICTASPPSTRRSST